MKKTYLFLKKLNRFLRKSKLFRTLVPNSFFQLLYDKLFLGKKEGLYSYGKLNPDKTFFVIRGHNGGLYSIFHFVLANLKYAIDKGYIPVVDYENYPSHYLESKQINQTNNVWEYFFKQPSEYTLAEVYNSENVILSSTVYPNDDNLYDLLSKTDQDRILNKHYLITNYLKYNIVVENHIKDIFDNILGNKLNVLAVYSRGTDYKLAKGHPIQPTFEELLKEVNNFITNNKVEYLFVSTEESFVLDKLIESYQEKVLYTKRPRIGNYDNHTLIPGWRYGRKDDRYLSGLDYLVDIELCSRCNFLVSGISGGSIAIFNRNGLKFNKFKIIDKGIND